MEFPVFAFIFAMTSVTFNVASACESVMGGCAKDATHDTSSHMKSQIVNKVKHAQPAHATNVSQINNSVNSKNTVKQTNNSVNLIQAINKAVIK